LLENAFKHGLNKQTENGWLKVSVVMDGETLKMQVENNTPAISTKAEKGGIGLSNLRKRLELLYPGKHKLEVEEQAQVFKVTLLIEL
jgi:two-component system, LytTR family, sensor kinase